MNFTIQIVLVLDMPKTKDGDNQICIFQDAVTRLMKTDEVQLQQVTCGDSDNLKLYTDGHTYKEKDV